jgi:hypothetical protein
VRRAAADFTIYADFIASVVRSWLGRREVHESSRTASVAIRRTAAHSYLGALDAWMCVFCRLMECPRKSHYTKPNARRHF